MFWDSEAAAAACEVSLLSFVSLLWIFSCCQLVCAVNFGPNRKSVLQKFCVCEWRRRGMRERERERESKRVFVFFFSLLEQRLDQRRIWVPGEAATRRRQPKEEIVNFVHCDQDTHYEFQGLQEMAGNSNSRTAGLECEGKGVNRMSSDGVAAASPTSVLVAQEEVMIGSCWESATNSPSQDAAAPRPHGHQNGVIFESKAPGTQAVEQPRGMKLCCFRDVESSSTTTTTTSQSSPTSSRSSLVETLQTCLTSLVPHTTKSMDRLSPGKTTHPQFSGLQEESAILMDAAAAQTSNCNRFTTASHSVGATTTKVAKRRFRASRRVPTTFLDSDPSDFQDLVQRLTSINAVKPGDLGVRVPQPKRPPTASTSGNKAKQPTIQGPKNSQTHAYGGMQAPGSRIEQNLNLTHQIQQRPSSNNNNNNRTQTSNHHTPPPSPPPPHLSNSSLTGLMYQPEEVTAFVNSVNTPCSSSPWDQKNLENKAIRPARIETATTSCFITSSAVNRDQSPDQLLAEEDDETSDRNRLDLGHHHHHHYHQQHQQQLLHHHHHSLTSDSFLPIRPNSLEQEEIDSWFLSFWVSSSHVLILQSLNNSSS